MKRKIVKKKTFYVWVFLFMRMALSEDSTFTNNKMYEINEAMSIINGKILEGKREWYEEKFEVNGATYDLDSIIYLSLNKMNHKAFSPHKIITHNGEVFSGRIMPSSAGKIWFYVDGAGEKIISITQISRIVLNTRENKTVPENDMDADVLLLNEGTLMHGNWNGLDEEDNILWESISGIKKIFLYDSHEIYFLMKSSIQDEKEKANKNGQDEVYFCDGQIWKGKLIIKNNKISLQRDEKDNWNIDMDDVSVIRRGGFSERVVFYDRNFQPPWGEKKNTPFPKREKRKNVQSKWSEEHKINVGFSAKIQTRSEYNIWGSWLAPLSQQKSTIDVCLEDELGIIVKWRVMPGDEPRWVTFDSRKSEKFPIKISTYFNNEGVEVNNNYPAGVILGDPLWYNIKNK